MNTETRSAVDTDTSISPAAALGYVHLTAANLERQIAFYQNGQERTRYGRALS